MIEHRITENQQKNQLPIGAPAGTIDNLAASTENEKRRDANFDTESVLQTKDRLMPAGAKTSKDSDRQRKVMSRSITIQKF